MSRNDLMRRPAIDRDALCPVTLRWVAEEHVADSHRCLDTIEAGRHRAEARRLRSLATRIENYRRWQKPSNVKGGE